MPEAERLDRRVVGGLAEQIDRDDGPGPEPGRTSDADRCDHALGVDAARIRKDVGEHRRGTDERDDLWRRGEGEARHDNRVSCPDPVCHQCEEQGVGAARARDGVANPAVRRQSLLERADLRPHDELPVLQHPPDRVVDAGAEPVALGLEIDERDRRRARAGHVISSSRSGPTSRYRRPVREQTRSAPRGSPA